MLGLLMASVFIALGELMLFFIVKNKPPELRFVIDTMSPSTLAMGIVAIAYPTWGGIGAVTGVLYWISQNEVPGGGIGSPNMVFTIAIVVVSVLMAAPFFVLFRSVLPWMVALTLVFIGLFGWLLPYFAA